MIDVACGLPSSNRGVSEFSKPGHYRCEKFKGQKRKPESQAISDSDGIGVGIDWFAASVDLCAVLTEQGAIGLGPAFEDRKRLLDGCDDGSTALEVASHVFAFFFAGCGLTLAKEAGRGRFYASRVSIRDAADNHVGLIEMGGSSTVRQDGVYTCRIELTGDGCRAFGAAGSGHAKRWLELRAKLESCAGRLTRVDVCADDLAGLFPVRMAMQWLEQGLFDNRGQKVNRELRDDFDSGKGKTLYIGSRQSEKYLRVYEKGRQLGDPESPWVRYEAEFKASRRKELPLDLLRDPAAYMLGAYPVLRFIRAMAQRIDPTDAAAAATWKSCRRHLKRQYGATLHFIVRNTSDDESLGRVIRTLTSPKLPAWANSEAAANWPEIVAVQPKEEAA